MEKERTMKYVKYALILSMMLGNTSLYAASAAAGAGGGATVEGDTASKWTLTPAGVELKEYVEQYNAAISRIPADKSAEEKIWLFRNAKASIPVDRVRATLEKATVGDIGVITGKLADMQRDGERNVKLDSPAIRRPFAKYLADIEAGSSTIVKIILASGHKRGANDFGSRDLGPEWYAVSLCTYGEDEPDAVLDVNNPVLMQYFPSDCALEIKNDDPRFVRFHAEMEMVRIAKVGRVRIDVPISFEEGTHTDHKLIIAESGFELIMPKGMSHKSKPGRELIDANAGEILKQLNAISRRYGVGVGYPSSNRFVLYR